MSDLAVVMPVYNEVECVSAVIHSWLTELDRLSIRYTLFVIDDGSSDGTSLRLDEWSSDPRLRIIHKRNEGHGPTVIKGYHLACREAKWVFQTDSDDEIAPDEFEVFWRHRDGNDVILGERQKRVQSLGRLVLSLGSRIVVRMLSGPIPRDTNVPFRLMRSEVLEPLLDFIPDDTFAPNVAITGLAAMKGARMLTLPVTHRERLTGQTSLVSWKLVKVAWMSLVQICRILSKCRRSV